PVQCPPDEACIGYTCVEPGGDCAPEPINDGLELCDDDEQCTVRDACDNGACFGQAPTVLGGVDMDLRLPSGAPTEYETNDEVLVDLYVSKNSWIKTCTQSGVVCDVDTDCSDEGTCSFDHSPCSISAQDCPGGQSCIPNEFCLLSPSQELRAVEVVLNWDETVLSFQKDDTLDPCDKCAGCKILCLTDADCMVNTAGMDDCVCPSTGAPPPCPDPPPGYPPENAECIQALVSYPDTCP
ncbi:MAG: hypothetical protein JSU63_08420, partial [Phycisphaerales bacterium]